MSRSIPKPAIWHRKARCFSLLSYTSISRCIAHKCLALLFFADIWHSTIKCLFLVHDNEVRCLQRDSNSPDAKLDPFALRITALSSTPPCQQRKQQNLIKFKCAIYFRNKLIRLKKPFTCPICQAYKTQQLSRTSNTYCGIVAASRHRLVQDTN